MLPAPGASGHTTAPAITPSWPLQKVMPQNVAALLMSSCNCPSWIVGDVTQNLGSLRAQTWVGELTHPEAGDKSLPPIGTSLVSRAGTHPGAWPTHKAL